MKYIAACILALVLAVVVSEPAHAHRPYYGQIEKIRLPNGELGEVRLLYGDGIFGTDPVRAVVVDAAGRLVARGPKRHSLVVTCGRDRLCAVVDLWRLKMLTLDAPTFRDGPHQPRVNNRDRTEDWGLEDGDESWGFSERDATAREILWANLIFAWEEKQGMSAIAFLMALGVFAVIPRRYAVRATGIGLAGRVFGQVLAGVFLCVVLVITVWSAVLAGFTILVWLMAVVAGAILGSVAAFKIKRRKRASVAASA